MEQRTDQAARDKVLDLLRDQHITMMTTRGGDGRMHSRPMGVQHTSFDGHLWFLTDGRSGKIADIERDPEVLCSYADPSEQSYVSVSGRGEVVRDRAVIKEHWFEAARTWFPEGADDPNLCVIRVKVESAEYWDSPSAAMVYAYGYAKAVLTGKRPDAGENRTVAFQG